jgi:hypothetical protein
VATLPYPLNNTKNWGDHSHEPNQSRPKLSLGSRVTSQPAPSGILALHQTEGSSPGPKYVAPFLQL